MKTITRCAAQGDVLVRRVDSIPVSATKQTTTKGRIVVTHSETGHYHAIEASPDVTMFATEDPLVSYLRIKAEHADIVHHRLFDTHETLRLLKGDWEIRRQREWTPEGYRQVVD